MLKTTGLIILLSLYKNSISQNFIQNGSFENTTNPNCLTNPFSHVDNWITISSPDYFSSLCSSGGYKVPINTFGVSYPLSGQAYVGIGVYLKTTETKEYIQQHLATPLIANKSYYTSFYVSSSDRFTMAIKNVGAYFSIPQPTVVGNTYFSATPQVENQTGFLTDTIGWTKIEGYFKAIGGEQYITIGNFNSNSNTDTLYTGSNDPAPGNPDGAYYYIDSVSLYDSLDYVTNIKELKNKSSFNLYPNPSNSKLYLEYDLKHNEDAKMRIFDISGKLVSSYNLQQAIGKIEMNEQNLMNGVYYYSIILNGKVTTTNKIFIIK